MSKILNGLKGITDFRSVDEVEISDDLDGKETPIATIDENSNRNSNPYDKPLQFQSRKEYYMANFLAVFHIVSPYIFVVFFFFCTTYINCLLQLFAQYQVEDTNQKKLERAFERVTNLQRITANLSIDLRERIMFEAVNLLPWLNIDNLNTTRFCTPRNCTTMIEPLYDFTFSTLPFISPTQAPRLADYYLVIWAVITFVRFLFTGKKFFIIAKRYLFLHSIIFFLRGLSIAMTILPNPYPECIAQLHPNAVVAAFLIMIGANYTCMDVFFSGHSVFLGLIMMTWIKYHGKGLIARLVKILAVIISATGWLLIIMTHFHYTLDVVYGASISIILFRVYFLILSSHYGKHDLFFLWFENRKRVTISHIYNEFENEHKTMVKSDEETKKIFEGVGMKYDTDIGWEDLLKDNSNSVAKIVVHHQ